MSGNKSFMRFVLAVSIRMEMFRPVRLLLVLDILFAGKQHVPAALRERKEFTVPLGPTANLLPNP